MQFIILILGLLTPANVLLAQDDASEDCGPKASDLCTEELNREMVEKKNFFKVNCKVLKATEKCLSDLADRCFDDAKKLKFKENDENTASAIDAVCAAQENNNDQDVTPEVDQATTEAYKPQALVSKNCGTSAATACMEEFHQHMKSANDASEVDCRVLKKTEKCLLDLADRCLIDKEKITYKTNIKNMVVKVNSACATQFMRNKEKTLEDLKTDECLKNREKLTSFLRECSDKTVAEMGIPRPTENLTLGDIKCGLFLTTTQCVMKKVGALCGQRAIKPFSRGMMSALTDPDAAKSPDCAAAILVSKSLAGEK